MKNNFLNSEETTKKYIESIRTTEIIKKNILKKISISHNFINGPFVNIDGNQKGKFSVRFYDETSGKLIHNSDIECNMWTRANRKYFTNWRIEVVDSKGRILFNKSIDLKNKRVYIAIDSSSIGDNIAWIPYLEEFRKKHDCKLIVSTFWNQLFEKSYPDLEFINPGDEASEIYAMYKVGCFFNYDLEPEQPNTLPLQKVPCNILGLEYKEIRPEIKFNPHKKPFKKYVSIAPHSTAGLKYWNNETGWQEVVDYLKFKGYEVVNVSKEGCNLNGVTSFDNYSMDMIMNSIYHSEFFIGLSSGLSWLAWSMNKHVFLISNFTNKKHEFSTNCTRIVNESVCNSCWIDPSFTFDRGDWNWCPRHKGTERQFECSKSITGQYVINKIKMQLIQNGT